MVWFILAIITVLSIYFISRSRNNHDIHNEKNLIENDEDNFRDLKVNIAGITHENVDGTSRVEIASSCHYNQKLLLIREPENKHDKNAVKVMTETGLHLGYVDAWHAKELQASLKGTSRVYDQPEAIFIELGTFENERGKEMPYCEILIRRYLKQKNEVIAQSES